MIEWGMPTFQSGDAHIHFAEHGAGFPVLTLAPGGMRSAGDLWAKMPWNPVAELTGTHRVITMDQRNAGASTAPVTGAETWATYTADQLALLDHLGIERCHLVGMCIGGAFIAGLLATAPERFERAVVLQPIGLDGEESNRAAFHEMFDAWAQELLSTHPEAGPEQWAAYRAALYDSEHTLFSVPTDALAAISQPMLVLRGDDQYHPPAASELLATSVPGARLIERWKAEADLPAASAAIAEFLAA